MEAQSLSSLLIFPPLDHKTELPENLTEHLKMTSQASRPVRIAGT